MRVRPLRLRVLAPVVCGAPLPLSLPAWLSSMARVRAGRGAPQLGGQTLTRTKTQPSDPLTAWYASLYGGRFSPIGGGLYASADGKVFAPIGGGLLVSVPSKAAKVWSSALDATCSPWLHGDDLITCHSCGGVLLRFPVCPDTQHDQHEEHEQHVTDGRCDHCGTEVPIVSMTEERKYGGGGDRSNGA